MNIFIIFPRVSATGAQDLVVKHPQHVDDAVREGVGLEGGVGGEGVRRAWGGKAGTVLNVFQHADLSVTSVTPETEQPTPPTNGEGTCHHPSLDPVHLNFWDSVTHRYSSFF